MTLEFVDGETYHIYVRKRKKLSGKMEYTLAANVCRGPLRRKGSELCIELVMDHKTGKLEIIKQIENDN